MTIRLAHAWRKRQCRGLADTEALGVLPRCLGAGLHAANLGSSIGTTSRSGARRARGSHFPREITEPLRGALSARFKPKRRVCRARPCESPIALRAPMRKPINSWPPPFLADLVQDLHYALRTFGRTPGLALMAVLSLGLGIGITSGLFAIVNGVLINPLPYKDSDRLVAVYTRTKRFPEFPISYPNFLDWVRDNRCFSSLAAYRTAYFVLNGMGKAERIRAEMVSSNYFALLGIDPVAGRQFASSDDTLGSAAVALVSESFAKSHFAGDVGALGKVLHLDDNAYRVVGVVRDDSLYGTRSAQDAVDVYVPIGQMRHPLFRNRAVEMGTFAIGRLKPGIDLAAAEDNMTAIAARLSERYPEDKGSGITLVPLKEDIVGNVRLYLLALFAAVAILLLIACANTAGMLLARSATREEEIAIRTALGARIGRLVRQLYAESALLSVGGALVGLGIAAGGTKEAVSVLPAALPRTGEIHLDFRVLLFTIAVSALSGAIFGLAPVVRVVRCRGYAGLPGRDHSGRLGRQNAHRVIVVAEIALTFILLSSTGLMVRSVAKLSSVNLGFDARHVVTFSVSSARPFGTNPEAIRVAQHELTERLRSIPGIGGASLAGSLPLQGKSLLSFWIGNEPKPPSDTQAKTAVFYLVQPEYFKIMGIRLVRGRSFTDQDNSHSFPVVLVDQDLAKLYFGKKNPIGQQITLNIFGDSPRIVGIVNHLKQWRIATDSPSDIEAEIYYPIAQMPDRLAGGNGWEAVVKTNMPAATLSAVIRGTLTRWNNEIVAYDFEPMSGIVSEKLARRTFSMVLLMVFSGIALIMSCVGIYGIVSHSVNVRIREIGVRMALGATPAGILRMILGEVSKMTLIALAIGVPGALVLTRFISGMLYGVGPADLLTRFSAALFLAIIALAAGYVAARRAARVDPTNALRQA